MTLNRYRIRTQPMHERWYPKASIVQIWEPKRLHFGSHCGALFGPAAKVKIELPWRRNPPEALRADPNIDQKNVLFFKALLALLFSCPGGSKKTSTHLRPISGSLLRGGGSPTNHPGAHFFMSGALGDPGAAPRAIMTLPGPIFHGFGSASS